MINLKKILEVINSLSLINRPAITFSLHCRDHGAGGDPFHFLKLEFT
jgi:hypothetical protein